MGVHTKLHIVNPKAQTVSSCTASWTPRRATGRMGFYQHLPRTSTRPLPPDKEEFRYIVFDGDVDAVWVENMNSVMDDNKLLTLPNGERIRLVDHVKLLFEVADLQYASPATVSRCGMVYVDPKNLEYEPYIWTWCNKRVNQEQAEILRKLMSKYVDKCIDFCVEGIEGDVIGKAPQQTVPQTNLNLVTQLCNMLECMLLDSAPLGDQEEEEATATEKTEKDASFREGGRRRRRGPRRARGDVRVLPGVVLGRVRDPSHGFNDRDRADAFIKARRARARRARVCRPPLCPKPACTSTASTSKRRSGSPGALRDAAGD